MPRSKLILVAGGFLLIAALWYWQTHVTYDGEVSHFETKVRNQVSPAQLQAWANNLVVHCSTSQVAEVSFPVATFPDYLKNLHRLPPYGFVFPAIAGRPGYVSVMWGSGFRGHWGLHVGSANYDDSYDPGSKVWVPGIFFWREHRQ